MKAGGPHLSASNHMKHLLHFPKLSTVNEPVNVHAGHMIRNHDYVYSFDHVHHHVLLKVFLNDKG